MNTDSNLHRLKNLHELQKIRTATLPQPVKVGMIAQYAMANFNEGDYKPSTKLRIVEFIRTNPGYSSEDLSNFLRLKIDRLNKFLASEGKDRFGLAINGGCWSGDNNIQSAANPCEIPLTSRDKKIVKFIKMNPGCSTSEICSNLRLEIIPTKTFLHSDGIVKYNCVFRNWKWWHHDSQDGPNRGAVRNLSKSKKKFKAVSPLTSTEKVAVINYIAGARSGTIYEISASLDLETKKVAGFIEQEGIDRFNLKVSDGRWWIAGPVKPKNKHRHAQNQEIRPKVPSNTSSDTYYFKNRKTISSVGNNCDDVTRATVKRPRNLSPLQSQVLDQNDQDNTAFGENKSTCMSLIDLGEQDAIKQISRLTLNDLETLFSEDDYIFLGDTLQAEMALRLEEYRLVQSSASTAVRKARINSRFQVFYLLSVFILVIGLVWSVSKHSYRQNEQNTQTEDPFKGIRKGTYKNGQLKEQSDLKNGKREGHYFSYYDNGHLETQGSYKNGLMEGQWVSYHDNGQLETQGSYKNGLKEGQWVIYNDAGMLMSNSMYSRGKLTGVSIKYYPNGKPESKVTYIDGIPNGIYETYRNDGTLFSKGLRVGNSKMQTFIFNRSGEVLVGPY